MTFLFVSFISISLFSYGDLNKQNLEVEHLVFLHCYGVYNIPYEDLMTGETQYYTMTVYLGEINGTGAQTLCQWRVQSYYITHIEPFLQP